jgi:hypothetical protein
MTIELSTGGAYKWRVNPYNNREIDCKPDKHNSRWQRHSTYATPREALEAMLQLETGGEIGRNRDEIIMTIPSPVYAELMEALDELDRAFKPTAESKNARLWVEAHRVKQ